MTSAGLFYFNQPRVGADDLLSVSVAQQLRASVTFHRLLAFLALRCHLAATYWKWQLKLTVDTLHTVTGVKNSRLYFPVVVIYRWCGVVLEM